ncbi:MAG: hypothetical protein HY036_09740 [Nitrospirae bacterium]|nr:hypothetical protein [Nitrospirota bacterium]MBI3352846.1 hypothetical protein [Nitrospirota bacterium]
MPKRGKQFFLLFFIFFLLFWTGCAREEIKKSENANRIHALYDSLDRLKKDYEAKNSSDFFSDLSSSYPDLDLFRNRTREVFSQTNTVTLNFYLDHIVLETSSSSLMVRWEGEWSFPSESPLKNGGSSILKFSNEPVPRLVEIQGINPFLPPAKEKRS